MSDPQIAPPWQPDPRCCWCNSAFVKDTICDTSVWICPSPSCFARQAEWAMFDVDGRLYFLPTPKQTELWEAIAAQKHTFICTGGSRGGGKSVNWRKVAQFYCRKYPDFSVLLLRREFPQLVRNHTKFCPREAKRLGAKFASYKMSFENGSEIEFGHCQDPDDYKNYIGAEVDLLIIDQIELFLLLQVTELGAAVGRIEREGWRGLFGAGENPGGPLSAFVNDMFIAKNLDKDQYPDYDPNDYHFIHSQLEDNPHVSQNYVKSLAVMKSERRDMFRFGRRDVFPLQFFPEWDKAKHVAVQAFMPTAHWFRVLRWGYHQPGIVLWFWVDVWCGYRQIHVRAELALDKQNEDAAVTAIHAVDARLGCPVSAITYANPDVFNQTKEGKYADVIGQAVSETLDYEGLTVIRADADEVNGWKRCHALLRDAPYGQPWLTVDQSCTTLIASIEHAMSDEDDLDLMDERLLTPALEAFRFGAMSRPVPDTMTLTPPIPADAPIHLMRREQSSHARRVFI